MNVEEEMVTTRAVRTHMMALSLKIEILSRRYSMSSFKLENRVMYSKRVRMVKISIIPDPSEKMPAMSSVFLLIILEFVMTAK
jgi:hypothetical protein